jgi:hypothetical protein
MMRRTVSMLLLMFACTLSAPAEDAYYKDAHGVFSTRPATDASLVHVKRFGPVGISLELIQPAFTMKIASVEEGSPAEGAGLKPGMIIETINGNPLADIDPRIQLGQIIAEAEATDGTLRFAIKGGEPVSVQIPVLGAYSETWPLACPKSDKIVRGFADYLASDGADRGFSGIGVLFLVSTGDERDLELAKSWVHSGKVTGNSSYAWHIGYGGIGICEYYLKTGDPKAKAIIQELTNNAVGGQYMDSWAGRGGVPSVTYGGGHLNAAGTGAAAFLLLAKECGAEMPDEALLGALRHFYRYAGRGNNPYGDDRPYYNGFVDNGKVGFLAFAMAAAAALTPDGEDSLYADARDWCANTSFYTTSFMLHGHTGGGIGEIWRSASMALMRDVRPNQYRAFMDGRAWHYDMSRRYDGSFGILGGAGYDKTMWGAAFTLAYTLPRGHLRIAGAPKTKHSKQFELPKRIWGSEADDEFLSLKPVPGADGKSADLSGETLRDDSIRGVLIRLHGDQQPSDDTLRHYMYHPYSNVRHVAACKILGVNSNYLGRRSGGGALREALAMEMLTHESPRVRASMMLAVNDCVLSDTNSPLHNEEVFALAVKALQDVDESWWVKDAALKMVARFDIDKTRPHVDLFLSYLDHEEDWLKNGAMIALAPHAADLATYKKVLPPIGALVRSNYRWSLTSGPLSNIRGRLAKASPEVQEFAVEVFEETYADYAGPVKAPGGQDIASVRASHMELIAQSLATVPGGLDALYEAAQKQHPGKSLPYKQMFLNADPDKLSPQMRKALIPIINDELIPEHVGRNHKRLKQLESMTQQNSFAGGRNDPLDQLAALHERAGNAAYGWEVVADLRNEQWNYLSFDPIKDEQVPWDQLAGRYREVTEPKGSENWFAKDFNAKSAGWKQGRSPFGQYMGKLPPPRNGCLGPGCYCGTPTNTLWEKEVLTLQGRFKLPKMEDGYRYRIRVNDGNHVGEGGGYSIYLNGELLIENESTNGRGSGGMPKGAFITKDFLKHLDGGEVTIAMQTFIKYSSTRYTPKSKKPQGRFSIHIERQKLPPIGEDLVQKSAKVVPMLTSAWQANQGDENMELQSEAGKLVYDGVFKDNAALRGKWIGLGQVAATEDFKPEPKPRLRRGTLSQLVLNDAGKTDDLYLLWSGDTLMDLSKYQALKMKTKSIDGTTYLFVEVGGFSERNKPGWKSAWNVLVQQ